MITLLQSNTGEVYYPFGMTIRDLSRNGTDVIHKNEYLYNGKMHQDEMGLNLLDYGARFYDAVLGRWNVIDPLADRRSWVSQYNYCQNSPVFRTDPTGALDWIPPTDGSGNWTAEKGDSPGSLARDANISQAEAEAAVKSANKKRRQTRTSVTMVYEDDVVNIESKPENLGNSGSSLTNSNAQTTPNRPFTATNTSGNSGNTAQTVNAIVTVGGLLIDAGQQTAKIPRVGYNIAYNHTLLKGVSYIKPLGYGASGVSFVSDIYLTSTGQQSLAETIANTAVTSVSLGVGGWPGLVIQADYQVSKLYMKTLLKNPDWAPYPIYAR